MIENNQGSEQNKNREDDTENKGDCKGPEENPEAEKEKGKINPDESGTQGGFGQGNSVNKGSEGAQGYGLSEGSNK